MYPSLGQDLWSQTCETHPFIQNTPSRPPSGPPKILSLPKNPDNPGAQLEAQICDLPAWPYWGHCHHSHWGPTGHISHGVTVLLRDAHGVSRAGCVCPQTPVSISSSQHPFHC